MTGYKFLLLIPLISLSLCGRKVISIDSDDTKPETICTQIVVSDDTPVSNSTPASAAAPQGRHPVGVSKIDAPRLGNQAGNNYSPWNLVDGNKNTAWAVPLDKTKPAGQWTIFGPKITFKNAEHLDGVRIRNGYCKSSYAFNNNTRATWIKIVRCAPGTGSVSDQNVAQTDIIYEGELRDTMEPQWFAPSPGFDNNTPTRAVQVYFDNTMRMDARYVIGDKYDDLCLTELQIFGK